MTRLRRPLLIGEAPGKSYQNCHPLYPWPKRSAGHRLYAMTPFYDGCFNGMGRYIDGTDRVNIVSRYSKTFPAAEAHANAVNMMHGGLFTDRRVLLVGKRALEAVWRCLYPHLDSSEAEPCTWVYRNLASRREFKYRFEAAYVPHTSGLNRQWNEPGIREKCAEFLKEFFS